MARKLLLVDERIVAQASERTLPSGDLVHETVTGQELIFLPELKRAEEVIAARSKSLSTAHANYPPIDVDKALGWCQGRTRKELALSQQTALSKPWPAGRWSSPAGRASARRPWSTPS